MSPTTAERRLERGRGPRAPVRARAGSASAPRGHRPRRGRRALAIVAALVVGAGAAFAVVRIEEIQEALREITLPLRHEDIIRQQADEKDLDPALIAAVIYEESKFRDRTSRAGAKGLMQIVPATARFIARKTGGTAFELRDLGTPQVNIAYGSWYLRYLLDRYDGEEELAVAAYNAGERNVDPQTDIAFPETRHYVAGVMRHRDEYAHHYARELGL
jgi:soluble lytic murein transglycosylase